MKFSWVYEAGLYDGLHGKSVSQQPLYATDEARAAWLRGFREGAALRRRRGWWRVYQDRNSSQER